MQSKKSPNSSLFLLSTYSGSSGVYIWGGAVVNHKFSGGTDLYCRSEPPLTSGKLCFIINFIGEGTGEQNFYWGRPPPAPPPPLNLPSLLIFRYFFHLSPALALSYPLARLSLSLFLQSFIFHFPAFIHNFLLHGALAK